MTDHPNSVLLLIPGWSMEKAIWSEWEIYFQRQYEIAFVDFQNCVQSADYIQYAAAMLEQYPGRIIDIAGWSLGAMVAVELAILYPKRVNSLILISAAPKFISDNEYLGMPPSLLRKILRDLSRNPSKTIKGFYREMYSSTELIQGYLDKFEDQAQREFVGLPLPSLMAGLKYLEQFDVRHILSEVSAKVCIINGLDDTICPPQGIQLMKKILPTLNEDDIHLIPGCGHHPLLTKKEACLKWASN
nr:alpha/beta hydrolase [Heliobacterium chlorum]